MSIKLSEIIKLIETCGKAGVKKFVHETSEGLPIHLEFYDPKSNSSTRNTVPDSTIDPENAIEVPQAPSGPVSPMHISQDFQKQEALRLLEEDFDQLAIEDPELYEELLAHEKLGDFGEIHAV